MILIAYILLATVVLLFVTRPLFASGGRSPQVSQRESQRRSLIEDRERVYTAIQELDFDYQMGKVEEADYRQTRTRYEQKAITLLKALDKANGRPDSIEQQVEEEVAALRRKGSKHTCADCGTSLPTNALFCPQCGVSVSRS